MESNVCMLKDIATRNEKEGSSGKINKVLRFHGGSVASHDINQV
jgi:hypothetical protein